MIEWLGTAYALGKGLLQYANGAKEVYDVAKGAYDVGKEVKHHFEWKEGEPKLVDMQWVQNSGFDRAAAAQGYTLAWSRPDKVASREIDGYQVMYELDKETRVKRKIVVYDGSILLGKTAAG
jgi:hypothetical protein